MHDTFPKSLYVLHVIPTTCSVNVEHKSAVKLRNMSRIMMSKLWNLFTDHDSHQGICKMTRLAMRTEGLTYPFSKNHARQEPRQIPWDLSPSSKGWGLVGSPNCDSLAFWPPLAHKAKVNVNDGWISTRNIPNFFVKPKTQKTKAWALILRDEIIV